MRVNRMMSGAIVFLMICVLLIGFQPGDKSKTEGIVSCSIDAAHFHDKAAVSNIYKQKSRLITIERFHASKLDNYRDLYIYLPPGYYSNPLKKYPVLYVQDGKGVFYISDWSKESLNMHLKADELIRSGRIEELIIVGISNIGDQRSSEYAHWDGIDGVFVEGKGELYEDFVINDVKPFIEANFRAKTGREHNTIMGASLGGLVSFNIGMRNPDIFSKIAVQSPYFGWGEGRLLDEVRAGEYKDKRNIKLWMDMGTAESEFMTVMRKVAEELLAQGYKPGVELIVSEIPGGRHSEGSWAERVNDILIYFYGLDK